MSLLNLQSPVPNPPPKKPKQDKEEMFSFTSMDSAGSLKLHQFPKKEVSALAEQIGFDLDRDSKVFIWFLKQTLLSKLPLGWRKECLTVPVYYNFLYDFSTHLHPNASRLRVVFNELI